MTRRKGAGGKATPTSRERAKRLCELVNAGSRAATGEPLKMAEIARRLSDFVPVDGKQYGRWAKGSTGLALDKYPKMAQAAIDIGWVTHHDLERAGLGLQAGLVVNVPSVVAEMRKQQEAEIAGFNKKRRSLVASLEAFEAVWRNLKQSAPKDFDHGHLEALNAANDAGQLTAAEQLELQTFNKFRASPRPDLLTDICVLQVELGRLRALPDQSQTAANFRPASMHDITPEITLVRSEQDQAELHEFQHQAELHDVLGENQYVDRDGTDGEYVIRTRRAFDGLIKLSRERSFEVLRLSHKAELHNLQCQAELHKFQHQAELQNVLGDNQYVDWDGTDGEYVIRTRGAFDGLIKLS